MRDTIPCRIRYGYRFTGEHERAGRFKISAEIPADFWPEDLKPPTYQIQISSFRNGSCQPLQPYSRFYTAEDFYCPQWQREMWVGIDKWVQWQRVEAAVQRALAGRVADLWEPVEDGHDRLPDDFWIQVPPRDELIKWVGLARPPVAN